MSRHPLGSGFPTVCIIFAYFPEIIGIIYFLLIFRNSRNNHQIHMDLTWLMLATQDCRSYVCASLDNNLMHIFPHNLPLFGGWRRCCWYACMLLKGLLNIGFLQTIPTMLEWLDYMMMIWTNKYSMLKGKTNLILSVISDQYDQNM